MKSGRKLLSRVEFASFLVYSPRGKTELSTKSRKVRDAIKYDIPGKIDSIVNRLSQQLLNFPRWFGSDVIVVPVPRSSPFPQGPFKPENTLWVSKQICLALVRNGLASDVVPCLERIYATKKSAYSAPGERPTVFEHYDSIVCTPPLFQASKILVVDDILTKGRTMLASASRVVEACPNSSVRGFALLRTMGLIPEIERIIDCCVGTLEFSNEDTHRNP